MNKKELNLTEGNIYRVLAAFVLPIILGSLIQQLYVSVDAVIVGQLTGKSGLAAIDSVHTLFKFPINFMNGLSAGATILISGYFGAKNKKSLSRCVCTACTLALCLGIISTVLGVVFTPQLLQIMAVPEDIFAQTLLYSRIYFSGLWALILYNMAAGILRAYGNSKKPLKILLISSGINIAGDLLLVGVCRLGVAGAAIATVVAQVVSMVCTFYVMTKFEQAEDKHPIWYPRFYPAHMKHMILTGLPLALQSILFPIANSIVQASVNGMGTDCIAAWGVCGKMDMLIWLVADAMSPALTTYIAQNMGAKKQERVKGGVLAGVLMSVSAVGAISLILYLFPGTIGRWFISSADAGIVLPYAIRYMRMMAPFYVFYAIAEAFSGVCCGRGDTLKPMITTLTTICLLRVLSIWLILPKYQSMECIVWIYIASWIASGIAFLALYLFEKKKDKQYSAGLIRWGREKNVMEADS